MSLTLGLALLAGLNVGLDLWLLGRRTVPSIRLTNVYRLMWLGFGINLLSGLALLAAYPAKALTNWVFLREAGARRAGTLDTRAAQGRARRRGRRKP